MLNLPILRWGQPYTSLDQDTVVHFLTGETLARVSQSNTGLVGRDMKQAWRAREALIEIPIPELIGMMRKAADFFLNGVLPVGDGEQTPEDFARQQSASTGLPERMCKANMEKNHFVLSNMGQDPGGADACGSISKHPDARLRRGESGGVMVSYQDVQAPVRGAGAALELARRAHTMAAL